MYSNKMALAVKVPSRNKSSVAREIEDAVYLPFGCEYSLLVKNLNSVRALVRVWIDGTDVTDGTSLVINPNSSLDLERFIKNGNLKEGNKFKFIERTAGVSTHRGNKIDDGLIRVEFEFERPRPPLPPFIKTTQWPHWEPVYPVVYDQLVGSTGFGATGSQVFTNSTNFGGDMMSTPTASGSASATAAYTSQVQPSAPRAANKLSRSKSVAGGQSAAPTSEVGITVAGDVSNQQFHQAAWFPTDGVKHVMVLRVLGEVEGELVQAPVTVKTKAPCTSCGRVNKVGAKFCTECGTGLNIV